MSSKQLPQAAGRVRAQVVRSARRYVRPRPKLRLRFEGYKRNVPMPVRRTASRLILRRPYLIDVPVDRLLLGAMAGLTAAEYATASGDVLWPSTPLLDGPHVSLLTAAAKADRELTDEEILSSPYGQMAQRCIRVRGRFHTASGPEQLLGVARHFIASSSAPVPRRSRAERGLSESILVAPVQRSSYWQVLDGHHRLATLAVQGKQSVRVRAKWLPVRTPLQDMLLEMSWLEGTRELYQPIHAPELRESWTIVRRCDDRRDKMLAFLRDQGLAPPVTTTYLDVACCYGWFVAEMERAGYIASGIERDPLSRPLGQAVYGLDQERISIGNATELLAELATPADVVSCFSLLHHFVLGRGEVSAEELVRRLDRATGRVLFLDTGQEHEAWFRESLRGWSADAVADFLRRETSFRTVIDLGPDADAVPPYADNYGRTLFACVR